MGAVIIKKPVHWFVITAFVMKKLSSHGLHQRQYFWVQKLKKIIKNVRIWRFFEIFTCINFRQRNAINITFLHKFYAWNTTANQIILQSYNSSDTLTLTSLIEKKTRKLSESGGFLPYDNYEQTNAIQLELF